MAKRFSTVEPLEIWTIGHSTRSASDFEHLLFAHHIKAVADVRAFPTSRRFPQFNQQHLSQQLSKVGVEYRHLPPLGGRRKSAPHSRNTAWRNDSFRAYADHMETKLFQSGISELIALASDYSTAFMCAESLWWKCHRSLIADYLKAKGHEVIHILGVDKTELHPYTSAARIVAGELSYEGLLSPQ